MRATRQAYFFPPNRFFVLDFEIRFLRKIAFRRLLVAPRFGNRLSSHSLSSHSIIMKRNGSSHAKRMKWIAKRSEISMVISFSLAFFYSQSKSTILGLSQGLYFRHQSNFINSGLNTSPLFFFLVLMHF